MKRIFISCLILNLLFACTQVPEHPQLTDGVSQELAQWRKANIKELKYNLNFNIPEEIEEEINAHSVISFICDNSVFPELDFKAPSDAVHSVKVNGEECNWRHEKEHIIIDRESIKNKGHEWFVEIDFTAPDMSLNRRADYMYTLLVPDRARTLFPCFDQPDLKANYTLELNVPEDWTAVSNTSVEKNEAGHFLFKESEPLSTYLFSFVAGKFQKETAEKNGRSISRYHRENDPEKLAQIPTIFDEVFEAIDWQENYTGMKYPFEKYDFIIIPGFQFGGMEHTGATLYSERLFLGKGAGIKEEMSRYSLIAHETSHMWFGDCVTMKWFNEVWTKEVFANFFAAKMQADKYKNTSFGLTLTDYARAAYSEDRTMGATPIEQELDNLKNAGLIYSSIVYDKSPIVMNMLEEKIGKDKFREGIQDYLKTFAYGNADWNDLIGILDGKTEENLKEWSHNWVEKAGMPTITSELVEGNNETLLKVSQTDPRNPGIFRQQKIQYTIYYKNGETAEQYVNLKDSLAQISLGKEPVLTALPNTDARGYGFFKIENPDIAYEILKNGNNPALDETLISSTLINLNENFMKETPNLLLKIPKEQHIIDYYHFLIDFLRQEDNPILFSQAAGYLSGVQKYLEDPEFDDALLAIIDSSLPETCRRYAFSTLKYGMVKDRTVNLLYNYFLRPESFRAFHLSESELTSLSYELAVLLPEKSHKIVKLQRSRISNPDRIDKYDFISRAVNPDSTARDSLFYSFLDEDNRTVEPWTASAISLLCHEKFHRQAVNYIMPGLRELEEIQMTGDIFFTKNWISALLSSYIEKTKISGSQ